MSHTNFVAASADEQREMLRSIGAESFDDLFSHVPADLQTDSFNLPSGVSEMEMLDKMRALAARNATTLINFCGAGFYDHYIPAAVNSLSSRGEFFTAYTPYQPEASQGTLQAIYEYQTAIARLTGLEAANASLYDGGTALFEAMMMALRDTGRNVALVDEGISPIYREMLRCYGRFSGIEIREVPLACGRADRAAYERLLTRAVGVVLLQNPNFFGGIDDFTDLSEKIHHVGAWMAMSCYPVSLAVLKTPGEMGADVATGEGQSLGLPLNFGGPYLGFMATLKKHVRRMPGRIVGATKDAQGRRGFVLTLQAREQHIRREKATSNICTNEALCALRALMFLSLMGRGGFVELARNSAARAAALRDALTSIPGVRPTFPDLPFFNEFALSLPIPAREVIARLLEHGIFAGFPAGRYYKGLENVLIVACTEKRSDVDIQRFALELTAALR